MVEVSVLFATRNGANVLEQTLEGYLKQRPFDFRWQLVIVDNGSTDGTSEIVKRYRGRLPLDSYVEPIAGKNRALNLGLRSVEGSLIIISDDDAVPHSDFLAAWWRASSGQLTYDIFGGSIEPLFQVEPPKWMLRSKTRFEELYAVRNLPEGPIAPSEIFGPNMAVRRRVFDAGLKFDESIGPNGLDQNYPMGSETEFCVRAFGHGYKAWFAPGPVVRHIIRPHQIERKFWERRAYRHGRGRAQLLWTSGEIVPSLGFSMAADIIGRSYRALYLSLLWCRTVVPAREMRFNAIWTYHWKRGFYDEYYAQKDLRRALREHNSRHEPVK